LLPLPSLFLSTKMLPLLVASKLLPAALQLLPAAFQLLPAALQLLPAALQKQGPSEQGPSEQGPSEQGRPERRTDKKMGILRKEPEGLTLAV
jgi:hypothetical protein